MAPKMVPEEILIWRGFSTEK